VATAHTTKGMSLSRQKLVRFLVMVILASTETRGSSEQRALNEFPNRLGDVNVSQLESGYSTASADPAVVGVVEDWIDSKWNWTGQTLSAGWKKKKTDDGNEDFLEWALDNATAALIYKDAHALGRLWNATLAVGELASRFDYCVKDAAEEAATTWPWPLPLPWDPDEPESICAAPHTLAPYLCRPEELLVFLSTVRGERAPETRACNLDTPEKHRAACAPGWAGRPNLEPLRSEVACCAGYFCPAALTCMIPCPLGAYCPRALLRNNTRCDPYGYKPRSRQQGCGGADTWSANSHIYCPGGRFCNTTTLTPHTCTGGHFCRKGSVWPRRCPPRPLVFCHKGTETITNNFVGIGADFTTFVIAFVVYRAILLLTSAKQARDRRRDLKILQAHDFELLHFHHPPRAPASGTAHPISEEAPPIPKDWLRSRLKSMLLPRRFLPAAVCYTQLATFQSNRCLEDGEGHALEADAEDAAPKGVPMDTDWEGVEQGCAPAESHAETEDSEPPLVRHDRPKIDVEFVSLGLRLKGSKVQILHGVTGKLRSGTLTAIMGPSGAGKTTFLMTLLDKAAFGQCTGEILINGYKRNLKTMRPVMGFVPQDDIMHSDLTVDENLWLNANIRLPHGLRRQDKLVFVERAVRVLGLQEVQNSVVGDAVTRGISGGQRKRVNVGIELVIDPMLLFCDEPTSGLDSTSSKLVVRALRTVARANVTVGVVCHQPSFEIFRMFDDLLLLGPGGRTVYMGSEEGVYAYFENLGFKVPDRGSPPEYLLDVIAGLEAADNPQGPPPSRAESLFQHWEDHSAALQASERPSTQEAALEREASDLRAGRSRAYPEASDPDVAEGTGQRPGVVRSLQVWYWLAIHILAVQFYGFRDDLMEGLANILADKASLRRTPGFGFQTYLLMCRTVRKRFRHPISVTLDYSIFIFTGSILGLVNPGRELPYNVTDTIYNVVAIGLMTTVSNLRTFGPEQPVFWREASSGMNRLSFFVAKDMVDHFGTVVKPALYMAMYYAFAQPRMDWTTAYLVTVAITYCCTGIAYLLSLTLEASTAQLTASVVVLLNALISTQTKLADDTWLTKAIYNSSFGHWGLEAFVIAEASKLQGVWLLTRCGALETLGYNIHNFWYSMKMLLYLGIAFRAAACACLFVMHRNKMR